MNINDQLIFYVRHRKITDIVKTHKQGADLHYRDDYLFRYSVCNKFYWLLIYLLKLEYDHYRIFFFKKHNGEYIYNIILNIFSTISVNDLCVKFLIDLHKMIDLDLDKEKFVNFRINLMIYNFDFFLSLIEKQVINISDIYEFNRLLNDITDLDKFEKIMELTNILVLERFISESVHFTNMTIFNKNMSIESILCHIIDFLKHRINMSLFLNAENINYLLKCGTEKIQDFHNLLDILVKTCGKENVFHIFETIIFGSSSYDINIECKNLTQFEKINKNINFYENFIHFIVYKPYVFNIKSNFTIHNRKFLETVCELNNYMTNKSIIRILSKKN